MVRHCPIINGRQMTEQQTPRPPPLREGSLYRQSLTLRGCKIFSRRKYLQFVPFPDKTVLGHNGLCGQVVGGRTDKGPRPNRALPGRGCVQVPLLPAHMVLFLDGFLWSSGCSIATCGAWELFDDAPGRIADETAQRSAIFVAKTLAR